MSAGRMSFLEELLADEPTRLDTRRRGKSVRFTDENDDNLESSSLPLSSRQSVATIKSDTSESKLDFRADKSEGKTNWLGLLEDDVSSVQPKSIINVNQSVDRRQSSNPPVARDVDNQGRKESRSQSTDSSLTEITSRSSQLPDWLESNDQRTKDVNKSPSQLPVKSRESVADESNLRLSSSVITGQSNNQSELAEAKVNILEIERNYLLTTIKQLNESHQNEIASLKSLHEQQLEMTTEIYKKQEIMLQEERDRRLNDLRDQLSASEKEKETLRNQYNERVTYLEKECREETERLRELHQNMIQRISEQHEADISRLGRIKSQELDALNALYNQSNSLESLIEKWQSNADRIENLHRSLMQKEEETIKEKLNALDGKEKRLNVLEDGWQTLKRIIENERLNYQDTNDKFSRLIEDQKNIIEKEREEMLEERKVLHLERKSFEEERSRIESELLKQKERLNKELKESNDLSNDLQERSKILSKKESEFSMKENELKTEIVKEKEELGKVRNELNEERKSLVVGQSNLQESMMSLQNEQHLLEQKKLLFDSEKDKLRLLADKIMEKAGQLEILGENAMQDQFEGGKALETATMIKEQTDKKLKKIEQKLNKLANESIRIESEKNRIQKEWAMLKETKNLIVCNLCGGSLSKIKNWQNNLKWFPERFKSFTMPAMGMDDTDQMLLIWRIAGEDDTEELARESEFLKSLKQKPNNF